MPRLRPLLAVLVLALPACLAAGTAVARPASPATGHQEPAVAAATFVDSIGVNVRPGDAAAGWALADRLRAAGIRHVRGPAAAGPDDPTLEGLRALAGAELQLDLVVGADADPAGVVEAAAALGGGVAALEVDDRRDPAPLRSAVRRHPRLPGVAVLAPGAGADYHTATIDLAGQCPGCGPDLGAGDAAVQVTEVTVGSGVPDAVAARYLTRLLLANAGLAVRTYLDGRGDAGAGPGLLDPAGSPTPAYHAVARLVALLGDRGRQFEPDHLAFRLSGATDQVHYRLLQKANGHFWLALWLEKSGWDPVGGRELPVPAQQVTLTLEAQVAGARAYLPELGSDPERSFAGGLHKVELEVTDRVLLLELLPDKGGAAPAPGPGPAGGPVPTVARDEPAVLGDSTDRNAPPTPTTSAAPAAALGATPPTTAPADRSPLAFTGSAALSMLVASALLMLVGVAALAASRRRYHHRH
jgi:hypothetical protein